MRNPAPLCLFLVLFCLGHLHAEAPSAVRISAKHVKVSETKDASRPNGKVEMWAYKITLQNAAAKDWGDLEVRCRVYLYPGLQPDLKLTPTVLRSLMFIEEKLPLASLKRGGTSEITTKEVDVHCDARSKDVGKTFFPGIWIRVFTKEGEEIGSLVQPPYLAKKLPWQ